MHPTVRIAWYREPWPWLLMAGPAAVVAAGIFTFWLAFTHEDGLVADDYYKQGLAINRAIARDAAAQTANVVALVQFREGAAHVQLAGDAPDTLTLSLVHPTRSGQDRTARLQAAGGGRYEGSLAVPAEGRWHVTLADAQGRWRLTGDWSLAQGTSLSLTPQQRSRP